jgi:diguanylate cyclase (GGDEF)-like protein
VTFQYQFGRELPTNPRRLAAAALVFAALFGGLVFLLTRSAAADLEAYTAVQLDLRELAMLDAEWNVDILRAHSGLKPATDRLHAPIRRMRVLLERLEAALPLAPGADARQAIGGLTAAVSAKTVLVEQFTAQNETLHNALDYLPPAVTNLKAAIRGPEYAALAPRTVASLDGVLDVLLSDVLRYNLMPDPTLAARIDRNVELGLAQKAALPGRAGDALDDLARNARAVVRYRQRENELETTLRGTRSGEAVVQIGQMFEQGLTEAKASDRRMRATLIAWCALLAAVLAVVAWHLSRSFRLVRATNAGLDAANEQLELRVLERSAEIDELKEHLQQLSMHDSLTGLINYAQLIRLIEHALVRASRRTTTVVIMFIDLDGFRAINDTYGHETGDLLLRDVATRVKSKLRKEDAMARLGGDEFVLLLEEVNGREGAMRVAQLALAQIASIDQVDGHPVTLSASIGISSVCGPAASMPTAQALLLDADKAMYQAKQAGNAGYMFSAQSLWNGCATMI